MPKRVALLTAGHLSSCPRLIKEAELLYAHGCNISIVYLNSIPRLTELDNQIIRNHKEWEFHELSWNLSVNKIISQLYYRACKLFNKKSIYIQSTSKMLIEKILNINADLYIAHHPTVLVAASLAASKYNSKYAYDIEDAFPFVEDGSFINNPNIEILEIEKKYIRDTCFTSVASPLYTDLYMQLYNLKKVPINMFNVFNLDSSTIEYKDRRDLRKISFYWYSQTVGLNRGLQDLFQAINYLDENTFELHIRGECSIEVKEYLMSLVKSDLNKSNIFFHPLVSFDELKFRNKEHDIGFALEMFDNLNRDLCITNKIFDYLRCGLMIVATNTQGQNYVTNDLFGNCITYNVKDIKTLSTQLKYYLDNKELINIAKSKSYQLARDKYNWEKQSLGYLNICLNELN